MSNFYIHFIVALLWFINAYNPNAKDTFLQEEESGYCFVLSDSTISSDIEFFDVEEDEDETVDKYSTLHPTQVYSSYFIPQTELKNRNPYFIHFILFEADTSPPLV